MPARTKRHKVNAVSAPPAAHRVMSALPVTSAAPIRAMHPAARRKATTEALAQITAPTRKAAIVMRALHHATSTTEGLLNVMNAMTAATALRHAKAHIAMTAETTAAPMAARPAARHATRWHLRRMQRHRARKMAVSACPK